MSDLPVRYVFSGSRLHTVWLLIRETIMHPFHDTIIKKMYK